MNASIAPNLTHDNHCFYLDEAMTMKHADGTHHFYPAIVVENEAGYYRTDYDYGTDFAHAKETVDDLNRERGLSPERVIDIVTSSFRAQRAAGDL
jgi:hypothetical protein